MSKYWNVYQFATTGWVVIDKFGSKELAKSAMMIYSEQNPRETFTMDEEGQIW